jgi:hypothetical protein
VNPLIPEAPGVAIDWAEAVRLFENMLQPALDEINSLRRRVAELEKSK